MLSISASLGWSILTGAPLTVVGYLLLEAEKSILTYTGYPVFFAGALIIIAAVYVEVLSPPSVQKINNEKLIVKTQPMLRGPLLKSATGVILGVLGGIGLFWTRLPLFYPALAFVVGLVLYATGLVQVWFNSLTQYYVTSDRIIKTFQFLGVNRRTMPREHIQGIEENKSLVERILGIGHVRIESAGDTGASRISARYIVHPAKFAEAIRK